jgi:hypothetical protein
MKRDTIEHIRQNLAVVAPAPEDGGAQANVFVWEFGHSLGVHMVGMNFFRPSDMLTKYMAPENFGVYSYKIKPVNLRYVIETLPDPRVPNDPQWSPDGDRNKAGMPRIPEQIRSV